VAESATYTVPSCTIGFPTEPAFAAQARESEDTGAAAVVDAVFPASARGFDHAPAEAAPATPDARSTDPTGSAADALSSSLLDIAILRRLRILV